MFSKYKLDRSDLGGQKQHAGEFNSSFFLKIEIQYNSYHIQISQFEFDY